jgi:hypothetical protein
VPYLQQLLRAHARELQSIRVHSDRPEHAQRFWDSSQRHLDFVPPDGWPDLRGA